MKSGSSSPGQRDAANQDDAERIVEPLPQMFLTTGEGIGGRFKLRPDDFLVEEIPVYTPRGEGEHLFLGIQKTSVSHGELMRCVARHFDVSERRIGFAGMKDKAGVTRQQISVHLLEDPPSVEIPHERIEILWAARHVNKLRRGHLLGNRFVIRIRDADPMRLPQVLRTLRQIENEGSPNYFGFQRFGYRRNGHLLGALVLKEEWEGLLSELLGARGSWFPEYQRERRELFDAGRYPDAAALWTSADQAERRAINALRRRGGSADACAAIGRAPREFWISALQSAAFNRVLDRRLEAGTLLALFEGDLAWKHDSRSVFDVTAEELATGQLPPRVAALTISPSGPMWGTHMKRAGPRIDAIERDTLHAVGISVDEFSGAPAAPKGSRRSLRAIVTNIDASSGVDEHGPFIRVAFDLPRGAYATVVLRELMKADDSRDGRRSEGSDLAQP